MKVSTVNFLIAVLASLILAYALWNIDGELKNYVAVGGFVFCVGTLVPCFGISYDYRPRATNLRAVSGVFFFVGLAINGVFSIVSASAAIYIVISALCFLAYIFIANSIYGAPQ